MNPDQLLDRMLSFSENIDCPIKKARLINRAYKTWHDNTFDTSPYDYNKVKHEAVEYIDGKPIFYYKNKIVVKKKNKTNCTRIALYKEGLKCKEFINRKEAANYYGITVSFVNVCIKSKNHKYDFRVIKL